MQEDFSELLGKRVAIIGDATVMALYGGMVRDNILAAGAQKVWPMPFAGGEKNKSVTTWQRLLKQLARAGADRQTIVVGLGGGISTDMAGFVAATYMRGVPLWLIPTSLLAMIDAAVGGKTAVNSPYGKNLIGAFYPAQKVLINTGFLQSLPPKELANGMAELIKIAFVADGGLLQQLDKPLTELIPRAKALKEEIVSTDLHDRGRRQLLNFGHTVGHALEKCCRKKAISHAEAVSIGMIVAAGLAQKRGLIQAENVETLKNLLEKFALPTRLTVPIARARRFLLLDKKNCQGQIKMVLPTGIGQAAVFPVTFAELAEVWDACSDRK